MTLCYVYEYVCVPNPEDLPLGRKVVDNAKTCCVPNDTLRLSVPLMTHYDLVFP
jgi:hypothetical protein